MLGEIYKAWTHNWRGIDIQVSFCDNWSPAYEKIQGHKITHIKVKSLGGHALPITDTDFISRFIKSPIIEEYGCVNNYISAWCDHAAEKNSHYVNTAQVGKQLAMF